ncbi:MAG: DUF1573 domain-containing protein [Candidatus Zixiibacteriota bacterium]
MHWLVAVLLLVSVSLVTGETFKPISVQQTSWDFGSVGIDFTIYHRFPLANTTDKKVRILGIESDCDCTALHTRDTILNPGDTAWIDLEFLTRDFFGAVSKSFFVKTDLPGREQIEMIYSARVGQWMWGVKPTPISVFLLQGQTQKRVQISNIANDKTTIEGLRVYDSAFTVDIVQPSAGRGEQMILDIKAAPNLANGTHQSNVTFLIRASGAAEPVLVTLPVKIVRF